MEIDNAQRLRDWLRECPELARCPFGVDHLAREPGGFALCTLPGELKRRENILGGLEPLARQERAFDLLYHEKALMSNVASDLLEVSPVGMRQVMQDRPELSAILCDRVLHTRRDLIILYSCNQSVPLQILHDRGQHGWRDPDRLFLKIIVSLRTVHRQCTQDSHLPASADHTDSSAPAAPFAWTRGAVIRNLRGIIKIYSRIFLDRIGHG